MKLNQPVYDAIAAGKSSLLLSGCPLHDFGIDSDGRPRTRVEGLRRHLLKEFGMVLCTFSWAAGLDWDEARIEDQRDARTIRGVIEQHGLTAVSEVEPEFVTVIRGISSLLKTPAGTAQFADGRPMRIAFLMGFTEHLAPRAGVPDPSHVLFAELAHECAHSLAMRRSGNVIIFTGRETMVDELLLSALHPVHLPYPNREAVREFIEVLRDSVYQQAAFEPGLEIETVAHLLANTPLRTVEAEMRSAHLTGQPATAAALIRQKSQTAAEVSEGTLTLMPRDTEAPSQELAGLTVRVAQASLASFVSSLARGDVSTPRAVLLCGPPGTGKSTVVRHVAAEADLPMYELHSPKGPYVGDTERRTRLLRLALRELGGVAWRDEVTDALPSQRSEFNGDSGASDAVHGGLLELLSDPALSGRAMLVGATNRPDRLTEQLRSRFEIIPMLHPVRDDYPAILAAIAAGLAPGSPLDPSNTEVRQAADLFYRKGASPRDITKALNHLLRMTGALSPEVAVAAAKDLCAASGFESVIFGDLLAVRYCPFVSSLPWSADPAGFPYPEHLADIVDRTTGMVDRATLDARLEEVGSRANL